MKKALPVFLLFILLLSRSSTLSVFAQQPSNSAGINIDPTNPGGRPSANDLKTLGAHWVRFVYKPNSGFNYNSYISELSQAGIAVTLILNQETLWPASGVNTNYISQFAQTAAQITNQFGSQVSAYEIWNEQDVSGQPTSMYISPNTYASLLAAAYNAIKTENNSLMVISGGLASGNMNYLAQVIQAAGGLPADGVGLHPYLTNIQQIQQVISSLLAISQNKPIWITEIGWQTPNQQQQANFLKDFYQLVAQFGNQVSTAMWYAWSDLMNPGFGLIDANGDPKLAFLYFQQYAALIQALLPNFPFLPFAVPSTFGACQAEQPFPGGPETKGESFVYQANCLTSAQGAVDAIIKTLKLDFPNNQPIAEELEEPLDKLKPYGYTPQVSERTALGKITFDVCEEGTTKWYTVEKEVEFRTPAWMEKMATEGKELASWLAPGGGKGQVAGEQTQNLATNSIPLLAQAGPTVSITSLSCSASNWQVNCSVNIDATPGTGHVWVTANGKFLGINKTGYGLVYYYDSSVSPGTNSFTVNVNVINHDRQPKPEDNASCTIIFDTNGNGSCSAGGGAPRPTPTPRICKRYVPEGDVVPPEEVCVAGNCQVKGITVLQQIQQLVSGVLTSICKGKTFIITPKVRTPFAQSADTFLREQTLSIFKVPSQDAKEAFEFEHALEEARHQFKASPLSTSSSQTEIYGQRGVKDSYEWVKGALTP